MKRFIITALLAAAFVFVSTEQAQAYSVGQIVNVKWGGKWYKSKILAKKGPKFKVHFLGWSKKWDKWVTPASMRKFGGYAVGQTVEVKWATKWYKSKILAKRAKQWRVHFIGWAAKWDKWVTEDKMRALK